MAVVAMAGVAALALAGCGGGEGGQADKKGSSSHAPKNDDQGQSASTPEAKPTQTLAEVKGPSDVVVAVTAARRDGGGFVTVEGAITNNGDSAFTGTAFWKGSEQELNNSGSSVAGAVLVDQVGKKRYYVLRDTEGRCLCTMKLISIAPKETVPFFAQFPAPPEDVTKVEFQLPTMPPAQIEISG